MSSNIFCVFECKNLDDKIWLFTKQKLRQCHEKLCIRKAFQMKYNEIVFPDNVTEYHGYHSICGKNFTAIPKKYLQKYDQLQKCGECMQTTASFSNVSGKCGSSYNIANNINIISCKLDDI